MVESHEAMTKEQKAFTDQYFDETIYPVLTPMAMDSARPFPLVHNKTLNIGALILKKNKKDKEELEFATVQVPSVLPRIVEIPCQKEGKKQLFSWKKLLNETLVSCF